MLNKTWVAGALTLTLLSTISVEVSHATAGIISFRGEIVNESCAVDTLRFRVIFQCDEKKMQSGAQITTGNFRPGERPAMVAEMKTRWIDQGHRTGILTLTYR